ncbi:MAG: ABC transporter permease subunit [Lachnospiraceae bacterium]|nr:ABC transporter permease subunit [Lachnospiraceae bacterium]
MHKLLSAEFARLFRSFVFRLCLIFSAGCGIFCVFMQWWDVKRNSALYAELAELGMNYNADNLIFAGGLYLIFVISVFISIFVGTEYSDGTIRNKLIVGHTRSNIYLSKFIVCATANIVMHLLYILVVLVFGNLLINGTTMTMMEIISFTIVSIMAILALTALLVLLSISNQSKAIGAVVLLLTTLILFFAALETGSRLVEPEYSDYYESIVIDEETNKLITEETVEKPNHLALTGTKREIYEFLYNFLPVSQIYQIAMQNSDNLWLIMIYDCLIMIVTTGTGIVIFQKKNLK